MQRLVVLLLFLVVSAGSALANTVRGSGGGGVASRSQIASDVGIEILRQGGNAVAVTTTLNNGYGNKILVDGAGFGLGDANSISFVDGVITATSDPRNVGGASAF